MLFSTKKHYNIDADGKKLYLLTSRTCWKTSNCLFPTTNCNRFNPQDVLWVGLNEHLFIIAPHFFFWLVCWCILCINWLSMFYTFFNFLLIQNEIPVQVKFYMSQLKWRFRLRPYFLTINLKYVLKLVVIHNEPTSVSYICFGNLMELDQVNINANWKLSLHFRLIIHFK